MKRLCALIAVLFLCAGAFEYTAEASAMPTLDCKPRDHKTGRYKCCDIYRGEGDGTPDCNGRDWQLDNPPCMPYASTDLCLEGNTPDDCKLCRCEKATVVINGTTHTQCMCGLPGANQAWWDANWCNQTWINQNFDLGDPS